MTKEERKLMTDELIRMLEKLEELSIIMAFREKHTK